MVRDGIININKPQKMTSHDVVGKLRRILGMKKIGHTGTLDPMATGVLPVCLGSATRITEYLDLDFKTYRCTMVLGKNTDTQDIWGEVIEEFDTTGVTEEAIRAAFEPFHGHINQKPPMYSAVRVEGRRLYEYARAGQEVDVKTRKIFIRSLNIESINMETLEIVYTVECSKGTYIRTICQDVGIALGTGAVMTGLVRLASGGFTIENTVTLEELQAMKDVAVKAARLAAGLPEEAEEGEPEVELPEGWFDSVLLPQEYPLIHFGTAVVTPELGKKFVDGWHIALRDCKIEARPEYEKKEPEMPIREEYRRAWNLFMEEEDGTNRQYLGVAFYNFRYKKLVADKVFFRGPGYDSDK